MRKYICLPALSLILIFSSCIRNKEVTKINNYSKIPNSVLIIYSSGKPFKTISDIEPDEVDAASGATPVEMNVKIISQKLYDKISDHYTVRLAKATEITNYKEILQYDMLIMGSPTYFWNVNREIKQMIDIHFEKIYIAKRDDFKKMKHMVFTMGENGTCARQAIDKFESAITDCSARLDASQVFLTKQSQSQYDEQITHLSFLVDSVMQTRI